MGGNCPGDKLLGWKEIEGTVNSRKLLEKMKKHRVKVHLYPTLHVQHVTAKRAGRMMRGFNGMMDD